MYGGTKAELERLIADANEYRASIGQSSDLTIDSFADIVQAIQSIQEAQGIAGTTAHEALTTIEGAANATKSAWQNVLTAIAGGGDLQQAFDGLVTAVFGDEAGTGLLNQLIPRVQTAMEGIGSFIAQAAPLITAKLPELVESIVPSLLTSAISLVGSLAAALPSILEALWNSGVQAISEGIEILRQEFGDGSGDIITGLLDKAGEFLTVGLEWIAEIGSGIAEGLPEIFDNVLPKILEISEWLRENSGKIFDTGLELLLKLAQGIAEGLPQLIEYIPQIISNICGIINDNFPKILETGIQIIVTLIQGLIASIPALLENIGSIVQAVIDVFMAINWLDIGVKILTFIGNGVTSLATTLPSKFMEIGTNMWNAIINFNWSGLGANVINFIRNGISGLFTSIPNVLKNIAQEGWNAIISIDWWGIGSNIINGIINGINSAGAAIANTLLGWAEDAWNNVCSFFGIHSPSTLFRDTIGKNLMLGIAEGVDENDPTKDIMGTVSGVYDSVKDVIAGNSFDIPLSVTGANSVNGMDSIMERNFQRLLDVCAEYFPQFANAKIELNTGVMVGEMLPMIDEGLGVAL